MAGTAFGEVPQFDAATNSVKISNWPSALENFDRPPSTLHRVFALRSSVQRRSIEARIATEARSIHDPGKEGRKPPRYSRSSVSLFDSHP